MQRGKSILSLIAAGTLAAVPLAQEVNTLLRQGDTIIGVGAFASTSALRVNDQRTWVATIDTDADTARDKALLRNWLAILREGNIVYSEIEGDFAVLNDFEAVELTSSGDLAMILRIGATLSGAHSGLFWNGIPIMRSTDPITAPGFAAGTTWSTFKNLKASNNQIMLLGETSSNRDNVIFRLSVNPAGDILSTTVLARRGLGMPATDGLPMTGTDFGPHGSGMNKHGEWIAPIKTGVGVYIVVNGDVSLGREGGPSVLPNRNWRNNGFSLVFRCGINDQGETIFVGSAEGEGNNSIYCVVRNGQLWIREGNVLPEFSSRPLGKGSASPLILANNGDVFWFVQDDGSGKAFMRNFTPIINEGITRIDGNIVTGVALQADSFDSSDDGRFWIGRVTAQVVGELIVFADFGLVLPIPGCAGNQGKLSLIDGMALPGDHLVLGMDNGQDVGVTPILQLSTQPRIPGSDCGVMTQFGEMLISPANRFGKVFMPVWTGSGPSTVDLAIPNDPSIVDATVYVQGVFWDAGNVSPEPDFRLTNALKIEIGAP